MLNLFFLVLIISSKHFETWHKMFFFSTGVSGGHLNPAVTVALATVGRLKWTKVSGIIVNNNLMLLFYAIANCTRNATPS